MLMSNRERICRRPIAWHTGRRWVLTVTCCSLYAAARAQDLPDPYSPFGLPRGGAQPEPAYRSFASAHPVSEHAAAEPRLPMLYESTFWQRLADYKVRGGVRVLTLLDLHGSTLALQAGHGANPSLQWTSRRFRAGSEARGLLDRLFSVVSRPLEKPLSRREPEVLPHRGIVQ
jgi:hypothetical protein